MNYLAHLFLSGNDMEIMLGNFIGDTIRRKTARNLSPKVRVGIQLHQEIDRFTDRHELFRMGVKRLKPVHGKYAFVLLDILYDHLLAVHWEAFTSESYNEFINRVYDKFELLSPNIHLPKKARLHLDGLLEYRYLEAYKYREGVKSILLRMDRKASFPSSFATGLNDLYQNYEHFSSEFMLFFAKLQTYTDQYLRKITY